MQAGRITFNRSFSILYTEVNGGLGKDYCPTADSRGHHGVFPRCYRGSEKLHILIIRPYARKITTQVQWAEAKGTMR